MITQIRKRNGNVVPFDKQKITNAIFKAAQAAGEEDGEVFTKIAEEVAAIAEKQFENKIPTVEEIQDIIEKTLIESGQVKTAKAYILWRDKRAQVRRYRSILGIEDDLKLPLNTLMVLGARYLKRDENRNIIETPRQLFVRVAKSIAEIDRRYGGSNEDVEKITKEFFDMMIEKYFMPNSPTLMNAGTELGQLSACFVLPVEDNIPSIFESVRHQAIIHQSGGGTGFSFSRLRPKNDVVRKTGGVSSGPITFMRVFDVAADTIKQGGKRRGANMGILRVDHPDILDFIMTKERDGILSNFNISVAVTDKFMKAVLDDKDYELINPRTNKAVGKLNARAIWNLIVTMAWKTGDPGIIFIDRVNTTESNPVQYMGPVESTNPCVTGDALVPTNIGLVRMNSLHNPLSVVLDSGPYPIKAFYDNGEKPVVKITTRKGYSIKVTENHKIFTDRGWKQAKDLKNTDKVKLQEKGIFSDNSNFPVDVSEYSKSRIYYAARHHTAKRLTKKISLPERWSGGFAEFLGLLIGDGWITKDTIGLNSGDGYIESKVMSYFGRPSKNIHKGYGLSHSLTWKTKQGVEFLRAIGFTYPKEVPCSIFNTPQEIQSAFLRGLFTADGSVWKSNGGVAISLSNTSKKILEQVQVMLLNFGILSSMYSNKVRDGNRQQEHVLIISKKSRERFMDSISFLDDRKTKKYENIKPHKKFKESFWDSIKRIETLGMEKVYDISVVDEHSFYANGILVHNCGEQPLYPYESCNLGSINLGRFVVKENGRMTVDWTKLHDVIRKSVHFLDNVIDANKYPLPQIEEMTKRTRRIGLGVMGWADMLILLGIPYNSEEALKMAERIMHFISVEGRKMSIELAMKRGNFPEFEKSIWKQRGFPAMRNATITTVAPTGTISIISECSQGIEPHFAIAYMRNVGETLGTGENLIEITPIFEKTAIEQGFYSDDFMKKILKSWSIQNMLEIPERVRKVFVTAHDISPEWHVRMQAAFQKYTDNAVSKTINFPSLATPHDVEKTYVLAYKAGCKGITIFRDQSRSTQVITLAEPGQKTLESEFGRIVENYSPEVYVDAKGDGGSAPIDAFYTGDVKCKDCQV
jgi:ribonucleoside-diphosphate reductase alpha chain